MSPVLGSSEKSESPKTQIGGGKSVRIDSRYTEAYGPHEVKLGIDGIKIYTKTIITCDEYQAGQIYVGRR